MLATNFAFYSDQILLFGVDFGPLAPSEDPRSSAQKSPAELERLAWPLPRKPRKIPTSVLPRVPNIVINSKFFFYNFITRELSEELLAENLSGEFAKIRHLITVHCLLDIKFQV